jgi:hypothetical protein
VLAGRPLRAWGVSLPRSWRPAWPPALYYTFALFNQDCNLNPCSCRETTEGLGRLIAKELAPGLAPSLVEQVDLGEEESAFTGVASQCLSVLVLGINTRLDACLQVRGSATDTPGHSVQRSTVGGPAEHWPRRALCPYHQTFDTACFAVLRALLLGFALFSWLQVMLRVRWERC